MKMEILMAELAATKEKVHASYENEHSSSAPAASELQRERPPDQKEVRNERWLWGIGALLAGAFLYYLRGVGQRCQVREAPQPSVCTPATPIHMRLPACDPFEME